MSKLKKIKYIGLEPSQTLESEKINGMIHCLSLSSPVSCRFLDIIIRFRSTHRLSINTLIFIFIFHKRRHENTQLNIISINLTLTTFNN
jgi:hypothetical protein